MLLHGKCPRCATGRLQKEKKSKLLNIFCFSSYWFDLGRPKPKPSLFFNFLVIVTFNDITCDVQVAAIAGIVNIAPGFVKHNPTLVWLSFVGAINNSKWNSRSSFFLLYTSVLLNISAPLPRS